MTRKNSGSHSSVIIIGGGPTGLSLGLGLAKHGVRSTIFEKKEDISRHSKAPVIHQRTREIFRLWGIEKEFLKEGSLKNKLTLRKSKSGKALLTLDFTQLEKEAHDPGMLILEQNKIEKILLDAVKESTFCKINFDSEVIKLTYENSGITVSYSTKEGELIHHGDFLIGCDGASSFVRDWLDLPFKGKTYDVRTVLTDVKPGDSRNNLSWPRLYSGKNELTVGIKISTDLWRLIHLQSKVKTEEEKEKDPTPADVDMWVQQVLGEGDYEQVWTSPFNIHRRSSPVFRKGRVILAGDAAHIHSPVGAQGMNAGIQDAHNLAWKLAAVVRGKADEEILETFENERKEAVVEEVSENTDFLTKTFLQSPNFFRMTAFFLLRRILSVSWLRIKFLRRVAMINIGYKDSGLFAGSSKAGGKRLPNVLLYSENNKAGRLYDKLAGETVIISVDKNINKPVPFPVIQINEKLKEPMGILRNLVRGESGWILVRPDAHIVWAGNNQSEFKEVLKSWNSFINRG